MVDVERLDVVHETAQQVWKIVRVVIPSVGQGEVPGRPGLSHAHEEDSARGRHGPVTPEGRALSSRIAEATIRRDAGTPRGR